MKIKYLFLIGILFLVIGFISGCSSDKEYTPPEKVESTPSRGEIPPETETTTSSEPETSTQTEPEPQQTTIFNVGDTATDNELKVTLNNVRFTPKIDEKNNQFSVAKAPSGKQYAIVDITIENILSDNTQTVYTPLLTSIVDQDGYTYNIDYEGLIALDKSFKDGEVLPNMKKSGEIAYLVPTDATDLKFIYKFDVFTGGTSAIFDIK